MTRLVRGTSTLCNTRSKEQPSEPASPLPALLLHLHHAPDDGLETHLEPLPPPLTVQPLPLSTVSLVESLPVEIFADAVLRHDNVHRPESLRNVEASRFINVDCPAQVGAKFHGRWFRCRRDCTSGIKRASDIPFAGHGHYRGLHVVEARPLVRRQLSARGCAGILSISRCKARSSCGRSGRCALVALEGFVQDVADV